MRNEKIYSSWNNIYICDNAKEELLYGILCEMDNMKKVKKISFRVVLSYGFVFFIITLFTFSIIIIKNNNTNENNVLISEAEYHDVININSVAKIENENYCMPLNQVYVDKKYAKEFQEIKNMNLKLTHLILTYYVEHDPKNWDAILYEKFDSIELLYRDNGNKGLNIVISDKESVQQCSFLENQNFLEREESSRKYFGEPYNYKKSIINNIEISIFKDNISHVAIFNNNETYYYIESANFSDDEIVDLIKYVINEDFSQCKEYIKDLI